MTVAEQKLHAAALVGKLAAENQVEALAIIAHMEWLIRNWAFEPMERAETVIRLVTS